MDCYIRWNNVTCNEMFTRVLTDYGNCFTYNMQGHEIIYRKMISEDLNSARDLPDNGNNMVRLK